MTEETTTTTTPEEQPLPCCVRHEDAGGQCYRPAAVEVYGLSLCAEHGEEARTGAAVEEREEVYAFLERFRAPHVPGLGSPIEKALGAALEQLHEGTSPDKAHYQALHRAYPDVPEKVRAAVTAWEAEEQPGYIGTLDSLLNSLHVTHKCMRVAFEEGETWLVEALELERESLAAQAAVALELADRREAERVEG